MNINPQIFRYFDGVYFEQLVMELYTHFGYNIVTTKTTGDQGVDLIMTKGSEKIAVQCKRYKNNINNKAIQEVFAGMHFYNCNSAMVVTSSSYTYSAKQLAEALNVQLIDCDDLSHLFASNNNYVGNYFFESSNLTQILINAGENLIESLQYEEAIDLLDQIVNLKDKFREDNRKDLLNAYNYLAISYKRIGNNIKAEETYLNGLLIESDNTLLNNLAVLYRENGRYKDAVNLLEQISIEKDDFLYQSIEKHKHNLYSIIKLEEGQISSEEKKLRIQEILNQYK